MKSLNNWYLFGWQTGISNPKSSQSSNHSANSTSWYEFGWRAAMNADLSIPQRSSGLGTKLRNGWQFLTQSLFLNAENSSEPRIWEAGQSEGLFNVRDPRTGRTLYGATEEEVRIWLEDRYNA